MGQYWGHCGAVLGVVGQYWGNRGAVLGALWAVFGVVGQYWGHCGAVLGVVKLRFVLTHAGYVHEVIFYITIVRRVVLVFLQVLSNIRAITL